VRAADPAPKLVAEHFMIDAIDPGIKLYVRNKRPEQLKQFTSEKTLLFVHGATQPAEATFVLPLEGLSWMDYIAQRGWDVYLMDVRGYGASTRPPEMDQPAANNPPIATTDVAVKDVSSAIDFILRRRGVPKVSLTGWSWGTVSPVLNTMGMVVVAALAAKATGGENVASTVTRRRTSSAASAGSRSV
jgi:pimeloyl-ACP methyl ester carboxylesterase